MKVRTVTYLVEPSYGKLNNLLEEAVKLAYNSDCIKRHGAVVVRKGTIIGRGWNKHRNNPTVLSPEHILTGSSIHAEIVAMRDAGNCHGADLYVVRLGARGDVLLSRPCNRCYTSIVNAGISETYHT